MPAKNSVKIYLENSYYHVYNRGAGKSNIFEDNQDYIVFLHYLEKYLNPTKENSFASAVKLLAYCLMPNHFHLLIHQNGRDGLMKFMRALCTSYAMYFNKRHERSGTLFQGIYKAANIESDSYLLHLSRYIHLNPQGNWRNYQYSSYQAYSGNQKFSWLDPTPVLDYFKSAKRQIGNVANYFSYEAFVEEYKEDSKKMIGEVVID